jgi:hypothetical protein
MGKFEVSTPDGRKFEIEAPDAQSASDTLDEYLASQGNAAPSPAYDEALTAGSQASQKFAGYQPSNGPSLGDRAMSFGQGVIEGVPIAGPWLEDRRVDLDATIAQLPGGMTPEQVREQAAERKAYLQQHAGNERLAGNVAGAVLPLAAAGLTGPAVIGRALGMTGGLGSQVGFGMLSGGAISGADTLARGGSTEDALKSAALGGAIGGAAPLVVKGVGGVLGGMVGKGVPKAAQNVARAMQADEITAPGLQRAMAQMGPDATLMDLGPNLQSLAGGIASVRGPGQKMLRDTITSRAKAGPARVAADVGRTIGKGQEIGGLTEQIVAAQKAAADPLYAAVRDVPIKLEGNLKLVASTPLGRQAFKQGIEMAANDGVQPGTLTIGVLDYAKQALDDIASEAKRLGKGNANRQAFNMARLLASEGDKIAPGYKQAREAFAGPAAVLEAIDEGKATFKADMSPADMQRLMADMTASEKDAFLQGAQTAVADLLGNSANDVAAVRTLLRKPYNEAKLRALIGSEATDDLLRAVDRELMFGQTANAVNSNSETARRTAAQGMVNPDAGPDIGPQGTIGLVFAAINAARTKLRATLQPKVNRDMAELLTSKAIDPRQLQALTRAQKAPRPLPVAPASLALPASPGQDLGDRPPLRLILNGMGANDPYTVQR